MSRRMRRRYLALKVVSEQPIKGRDIMDAVLKAVLQLFGEYGASQASLSLIKCNSQKNYAIVRCSHTAVDMIRASVASITEMNEKPAAIHVLRVSGTLRTLRKKALLQG
ncbi:MAG: Ribonuclease P protein component 2 [Candidatus Bathyarchaeota archaeon BA2]|nr:MAG: Ribonuclease P protein component 2 [Candidatus Bathyarchaeota archaeon BA2]